TVLVVTVLVSLLSPKGRAQAAVSNARREAVAYVEMTYAGFEARRDAGDERMPEDERTLQGRPAGFPDAGGPEQNGRALLAAAPRIHEARLASAQSGERSAEQPEGLIVTRADGTVATDGSGKVVTVSEEEAARARSQAEHRERE